MLKRILFAIAPLMLVAGTVVADDNLLSTIAKLDAESNSPVASAELDELGAADVEALLGEDDGSDEEAIAACFRRIRYGYGYRSYRHCYSYRAYTPVYHNYTCYPSYHYRPVYTSYYTPVYSNYWGCW